MSKAFTREDDTGEQPVITRRSPLPFGAKNYITSAGAAGLRAEVERLIQVERPQLLSRPEDMEAKRQLQVLDARISELQNSLQSAVVVEPPAVPDDQVRFGATVTVREKSGSETVYRIVGVDETDFDRGWVSWLSPVAKALVNARVGQRVRLKLPSGDQELEVVRVAYED